MKITWVISIVAVGVIGFFIIFSGGNGIPSDTPSGTSSDTPGSTPDRSASKMLGLSFKDYDGNIVSLADYPGKSLVINSWAVWCPFCVKELGEFAEIQKELGDSIVFIAIGRAEPLSVAKPFTDDLGVTDDLVFLLDPSDSFYKSIGGFSMPETIFVDKDGNTRFHKRGPMDADEIRSRVSDAFGL